MTRVAAFDCGTNSLRLLVVDLDPATGHAREIDRQMRIVRLGEGVDRTGRISATALQRVMAAVDDFVAIVDRHQVERIRFCATSAAREAENTGDFVAAVRARVGVAPDLVDGSEEARLSFAGAVRSLRASLPTPYLVADIGGGSTELVLGSPEGEVSDVASLDLGSVRMTERHLHSDPPTRDEIAAVRADVEATLDGCPFDPASAGAVIGVAGTVTTIAAGALRLQAYDRSLIHHSVIDVASVQGMVTTLLHMSVEQRKALPYMHPGRADVIAGGGLVLTGLLRRADVYSMLVSEQDILDGIAWSLVEGSARASPDSDDESRPGPTSGQSTPDKGVNP
ncbi:MAG: exopolyphosphatase [Marmoricola sp.]